MSIKIRLLDRPDLVFMCKHCVRTREAILDISSLEFQMLYAGMTEHQMNLLKKGLFEQECSAPACRFA